MKWTRKTTEKIASELKNVGISVCANIVGNLLKKMDYSLRVNHKKSACASSITREQRDQQFGYINKTCQQFDSRGNPRISIDAKKKELIGNFKNPGTSWEKEPVEVNDHDFRSQSEGIAIPYGIYDTQANRGFICLGTSYDTPAFAVESITKWWTEVGCKRYPNAKELLILADTGGSNSARSRVWKFDLQKKLSTPFGITITVCHYPPGCSKWNPIEHRLFSMISKNWAGKPLKSYETVLKYIRTTKTKTGLKVKACLVEKNYAKGQKVSDQQMAEIQLQNHKTFPKWNYTIKPEKCEVVLE